MQHDQNRHHQNRTGLAGEVQQRGEDGRTAGTVKQSDLDILLREGEGSMLEYKEALSSSFARELVAFANSTGGKILFGVRNDGTVAGVRDSNDLRARIQDIARNCDRPINVIVEPVGMVVAVTVRESERQPGQGRKGVLWQPGASQRRLSRDV